VNVRRVANRREYEGVSTAGEGLRAATIRTFVRSFQDELRETNQQDPDLLYVLLCCPLMSASRHRDNTLRVTSVPNGHGRFGMLRAVGMTSRKTTVDAGTTSS